LYQSYARILCHNDSLSSVGDDLGGDECKYSETVVGNDDCVSIEERRECRRQTHLQNSTIFPRFRPLKSKLFERLSVEFSC
jgi:hypothetical protein